MYDVVVIGGGPGGYAAAIRASQLDGRAVLVEAGAIGGTCVNLGCIPTKTWHRTAYLMQNLQSAGDFGVKAVMDGFDPAMLKARKDGVANDIRMGMEALLANNGVEVIAGRGVLKSPSEVEVEGQVLEAKKIILATGSRLAIPDIPGLEDAALTTNQALDLEEIPGSVLVWGAGPIEMEMAVFLSIFGAKVVVAAPDSRILPQEDHDTSRRVAHSLQEAGLELQLGYTLKSVAGSDGGFDATLSGSDEKVVTADRVLIGGRRPNTDNLGLDRIGIHLNEDGGIQVNDKLETSASGVYAIGDCTGGWMLSHAASAMAVTAAENAMGMNKKFPFHLIPRGIWSIPEIGSVGLSEQEAAEKGYDAEAGYFPYAINGLAMTRGEMAGETKIVFDPEFGEILGVHIVGANATELIGEAALAMQLECTVKELTAGIRVHPTYSETVVDASRDALEWALYLPKR